eukprot:2884082-Rhodomonas_salina.6
MAGSTAYPRPVPDMALPCQCVSVCVYVSVACVCVCVYVCDLVDGAHDFGEEGQRARVVEVERQDDSVQVPRNVAQLTCVRHRPSVHVCRFRATQRSGPPGRNHRSQETAFRVQKAVACVCKIGADAVVWRQCTASNPCVRCRVVSVLLIYTVGVSANAIASVRCLNSLSDVRSTPVPAYASRSTMLRHARRVIGGSTRPSALEKRLAVEYPVSVPDISERGHSSIAQCSSGNLSAHA